MPFKYPSMAERLIANSIVDESRAWGGTFCWAWIGSTTTNRSGMKYGKLDRRISKGPRKGQKKTEKAHRVAIRALKNKRLSQRQVVMHLCNWSLCINPEHLLGGTQKRNVRQTVKDGRHRNAYSEAVKVEQAAYDAAARGEYDVAYGLSIDAEMLRHM